MAERQKPRLLRVMVTDPDGTRRMETVRADSIKSGPPDGSRRALGEGEKDAARDLWRRVGRRARPDLDADGWVEMFTVDVHPENELRVWKRIADVEDRLWSDGVGKTRDDLLTAILRLSIGEVDIPANLPGVSDKTIAAIRAAWEESFPAPAPLEGLPDTVPDVPCPIYALSDLATAMAGDWQSRECELRDMVREADVIISVSRNGAHAVFFGREKLALISSSELPEPASVVAFLIDPTDLTDDVEVLAATVETLKGYHEYGDEG